MPAYLLYITAASNDEAENLANILVSRRLAACVNVLGQIRSLFHWQGGVDDATEVAMIAKTAEDRLDAAIDAIRDAHSYDCPCIVALPIAAGHAPFLDWIATETRPAPETAG